MSGEVEVPKTPDWLKSLEEKRERRLKARLGHEAGAGAPCLKCEDKCPGLDLHFWRKNCKICRCSKEDHDTHDDDIYSWAQFELLGSKPNRIKTKIVLPGKKDEVELEWAPRGQKDTIDKYLKTLPPEKIPVKGSQAAQERKQALQKQIPIHDIDPLLCHELNEEEVEKMNEYIAHVKKSSVGVGQIVNLSNVIKANLHNISPQEAHIIATRYSKGIPYSEIVKLQAGLSKNLEKLTLNDPKNKNLPNMQPQSDFDTKEFIQNPTMGSKMRDLNYQNVLNSNQHNPIVNPHYAQGLLPKQPGVNQNDQVPFDYRLDEKLLHGTNFDPSKTPSQFKGYHTQGYRHLGQQLPEGMPADEAQRYFDDINNMVDEISGVLEHGKVPYNIAFNKNLQNPNSLCSGYISGNQENIPGLPYNQVRDGFKASDAEYHDNVNIPNYCQNLGKNEQNLPKFEISSLPYNQVREGFTPYGVEHQVNVNSPNYTSQNFNIGGSIQNTPYNQISDEYKATKINTENYPSQLPLYAQRLAGNTCLNQHVDSEKYGFENPMFNLNNVGTDNIPNYAQNQQGNIYLENQNSKAPKNMKDLIYSTYDPSNSSDFEKEPNKLGTSDKKVLTNEPNAPFDPHLENINTQHGSLGYAPGTNIEQFQNTGSLRHPLLDKYGNVESNPAYTGELCSPQAKSGQAKVSGLKNLFELNKNAPGLQRVDTTEPKSAFYDPRGLNRSVNDSKIPGLHPKDSHSAFYDPKRQGMDLENPTSRGFDPQKSLDCDKISFSDVRDPRMQGVDLIGQGFDPQRAFYDPNDPRRQLGDPKDPRFHSQNAQKVLDKNQSAFYDPRGPSYDASDPRMQGVNPKVQGADLQNALYDPTVHHSQNASDKNQSAFRDPRGHSYDASDPRVGRQLPQMQPGYFNISEEYLHPNQINIGAIRDINYPDMEIKEAMIATNPDDDFYGEDYSPDSIKELINNVILPNCHYCKKPFEENEFAVTIERANVLFHAECFKCAGCNQSLADNIYFYHKESNNVYCGRDYAKIKGYPRCNACDELIFTKEYCLAEHATFHLKHFCCFQCDTPLAGKEYTLEDEQPYCLPCFEMTKASRCGTCQNIIKPDERGCNLNGVHFHAEDDCFACIVCKKPLMGQKLLLRNEKLYCSHDCFNSSKLNQIV